MLNNEQVPLQQKLVLMAHFTQNTYSVLL
jgi:hypothetical protein